jgi:hypothetical protein
LRGARRPPDTREIATIAARRPGAKSAEESDYSRNLALRAADGQSMKSTNVLATSLCVLLAACAGEPGPPGPAGETGAAGAKGDKGDQGLAPTTATRDAGTPEPRASAVWKDANGKVIPIISLYSFMSGTTPYPGFAVFADAGGAVWGLSLPRGGIGPAWPQQPLLYSSPDCSGPAYAPPPPARFTYLVGPETIPRVVNDNATIIDKFDYRSTKDPANGNACVADANSRTAVALSDTKQVALPPSSLFTLPFHPEYAP